MSLTLLTFKSLETVKNERQWGYVDPGTYEAYDVSR